MILQFFLLIIFVACASSQNQLSQADLLLQDGLYPEAVSAYKKDLKKTPNHPQTLRHIGIAYVKMQRYKEAEPYLRKSYTYQAQNFDTLFFLGEAIRGQGNYSEALFFYQAALLLRDNDLDTLKALSWCHFKTKSYNKAYILGKKIFEQNSNDPQAAIIFTHILIKREQYSEAENVIKKTKTKSAKKYLPYINSLEAEIAFNQKNLEFAEKKYRDALKEQPLLFSALLGLSRIFFLQKKFELAEKYSDRASRLEPQEPMPYQLLGQITELKGDKHCLNYYQKFYDLTHKDPEYLGEAKKIRKKIVELTKDKRFL